MKNEAKLTQTKPIQSQMEAMETHAKAKQSHLLPAQRRSTQRLEHQGSSGFVGLCRTLQFKKVRAAQAIMGKAEG